MLKCVDSVLCTYVAQVLAILASFIRLLYNEASIELTDSTHSPFRPYICPNRLTEKKKQKTILVARVLILNYTRIMGIRLSSELV